MNLFESGDSTGDVAISDLLNGKEIAAQSPNTIKDIARFIVGGG